VLYQLALTTGLRAAEIRSLTGRSIDFDSKTLHISSAYTKNRQDAILPLPEQIVDDLKTLTAGKHPDAPLFKLTDKTANLIRSDLNGAKKFYAGLGQTPSEKTQRMKDDFLAIETANGEIDFHALRHSFGSMLAASGVHPKTAQILMRHSTITLTLDRYSHSFREAEMAAVNGLPNFECPKKETSKQA
jgi:integrase